eukprot:546890-Rhodomonas_salina.1
MDLKRGFHDFKKRSRGFQGPKARDQMLLEQVAAAREQFQDSLIALTDEEKKRMGTVLRWAMMLRNRSYLQGLWWLLLLRCVRYFGYDPTLLPVLTLAMVLRAY